MNRSGYSDDVEGRELALWRGAVAKAINGRRGQAFLREMLVALDAMPVKELIAGELQNEAGAVCAIGCVGVARGIDMAHIDYEEPREVAAIFGISHALAAEIEYMNDEAWFGGFSRRQRFRYMRAWIVEQLTMTPL